MQRRLWILLSLWLLGTGPAWGHPGYDRPQAPPCAHCHDPPPRLNATGRALLDGQRPLPTGGLAETLAARLTGTLRWGAGGPYRTPGEPDSGALGAPGGDLHIPRQLVLLSSTALGARWALHWRLRLTPDATHDAPWLETAWVRRRGEGHALILGRFAWSQWLLDPNRRLTEQGYFAYRLAGWDTSAPGLLQRWGGPRLQLYLGLQNERDSRPRPLETPGLGRTGTRLDLDPDKRLGLRLALRLWGHALGVTALGQRQRRSVGLDLQGRLGRTRWFGQWLRGWENGEPGFWEGGFLGLQRPLGEHRWLALLLNRLTPGHSGQGRRNARLVTLHFSAQHPPHLRLFVELDLDFQPPSADHAEREDALTLGLDLSY